MRELLILFISFSIQSLLAQGCVEGNCSNGYGVYKWSNGSIYAGQYKNGKMHGYGEHYWSSGTCFKGQWQNGDRKEGTTSKERYLNPDIKIGKQFWQHYNLNTSHFQNGDEIYQAKNLEEWNKACRQKKPAWCYYEFMDFNGDIFGKLYNYYAVTDSRGLAPKGYRVATTQDWNQLVRFLEDEEEWIEVDSYDRVKSINSYPLKSRKYWNPRGLDVYGFRALPGGNMQLYGSNELNVWGCWWLPDKRIVNSTYPSTSYKFKSVLFTNDSKIDVEEFFLEAANPGLHVRCIKE